MNILNGVIALILTASSASANSYPNAISPQDAKARIDAGQAVLIDVREQAEVALGMPAPALWYPKSSIDKDPEAFLAFLSEYSGQEIIISCRSGHRASLVVAMLARHDIHAWNMGGYQEWVDAGFPTRKLNPLQ